MSLGLAEKRQPVVLTVLFVLLKIRTRRGYVKLDNDVAVLQKAIERLKQPKRERQPREEQKSSDFGLTGIAGAELDNGKVQSPEPNHDEPNHEERLG